ncbi:MAG: DnaB-like helicase N-terminal domain-containing protein [Microthrixaceae bacterium]
MSNASPGRPVEGRVPPHNVQAEESLLGAMLLKQSAISESVQSVNTGDFYKPAHADIYDAISTLYAAGEPVDPVTVAAELKRAGLLDAIGGPAVLLSIQARTPAVSNAAHYAKIVEENASLRKLVQTASDIAELGYAPLDDVTKTLDYAESMMYDVAQRRVSDTMVELRDLLDASLDRLEALYERGEAITGTPSGYTNFDVLTAGLQPNALIVVGEPAMGKTSFALGAAGNAALALAQARALLLVGDGPPRTHAAHLGLRGPHRRQPVAQRPAQRAGLVEDPSVPWAVSVRPRCGSMTTRT